MATVTFSMVILLLVYSQPTTAWFGGGGGRSSNNGGNNGGDNGGNKDKGGTSVDAGVEVSKDGGAKGSVGVSHKGDGWSGGAKGTVDSDGNWEAKVGVSIDIPGKRSIDLNGRHYTVRLDPCYFGVYDGNKDGVILKSEIRAITGENNKADELFEALDITTGDGRIEEDEFYFMLPMTINGCQEMDQVQSNKL